MKTFRHASLFDRPILHRSQLLFVTRLIATHGAVEAGNRLMERDDFDVIGDLLFLANGLFRTEQPSPESNVVLWLATQMGPMYEVENPPDLSLTWPRACDLLLRRLPEAAHDSVELERLERVFLFTTGFSMQNWTDLNFLLFSYWSNVTFRDLMANKSRAYLDPSQPHDVISEDLLVRALHVLAVRFDELPEQLNIGEFSRATLFDATPFREKPLWMMPNGRVLCVDTALLMERLGPHIFWSVMNALDTEQRRRQFTGTWGRAFEDYCLDAFEGVFRGKKWEYHRNPIDETRNEELWDGLALRGEVAIVIECKGTFITSAEKYSGEPSTFFRGLTRKFGRGKHGGVFQLVRGISRVWFEEAVRGPMTQPQAVKDVFSILVVQEPIFECGPVARVLSDRFAAAICARRRRTGNSPRIWPLTVMTANDLDRVSMAVTTSGARIDAFLKGFHRSTPSRMVPLANFFNSRAAAYFGAEEPIYAKIRARFDATAESTLKRFQDSHYGGSPIDRGEAPASL